MKKILSIIVTLLIIISGISYAIEYPFSDLKVEARNDRGEILKDKDGLIYVECKHYNESNKITVNLIHKLISACTVDGIKRGIFITTSVYTSSSIELVEKCDSVDIDIWYKDDLLEFCKNIDRIELLEWLGYDKDEVLKYCAI
jgi:predicted helicase